MSDQQTSGRSHRRRELVGAAALPAAVAVSFVWSAMTGTDWWDAFPITMLIIALPVWIWQWFTAPEQSQASDGAGPPNITVPKDAKLGALAAAGIIAAFALLFWIT